MKDLKKAEIYFENGKCTIITYNEFTNNVIEKAYFFGIKTDYKFVNTAIIPWNYLIIFLD